MVTGFILVAMSTETTDREGGLGDDHIGLGGDHDGLDEDKGGFFEAVHRSSQRHQGGKGRRARQGKPSQGKVRQGCGNFSSGCSVELRGVQPPKNIQSRSSAAEEHSGRSTIKRRSGVKMQSLKNYMEQDQQPLKRSREIKRQGLG